MKYYFDVYKGIDDLLRKIESRPVNTVFKDATLSSNSENAKFSGTANYQEAVELFKSGWEDPVKDLKAEVKAANIRTNVTETKHRPRNSVVGYAPCVPAAILGLPESMIATERTPSKIKAVSIVHSVCANAATKTQEFLKAGAAVLKIVNDLELKGYRVQLDCEFDASVCGQETTVARFRLKDWRQPLDLKKLTFPMAHASMLRRIGFRHTETHPGIKYSGWTGCYGRALSSDMNYKQQVAMYKKQGMLAENEFFITLDMAKKNGYDTEKIMKQAGMKL